MARRSRQSRARYTKVNGTKVPVHLGRGVTEVYFSRGEHGLREKGWYRFWTAVGEDCYGPWVTTGRARKRLPAGDRFDRMHREQHTATSKEDRKVYALFLKRHKSISYIRPSTEREVMNWVRTHSGNGTSHDDALYIEPPIVVRGKTYKRGLPRNFI